MCSKCDNPSCEFDKAMEFYESIFGKFEIPEWNPEVDGRMS